jgi:hypothetical protein
MVPLFSGSVTPGKDAIATPVKVALSATFTEVSAGLVVKDNIGPLRSKEVEIRLKT